MQATVPENIDLNSLFQPCRQCGTCCKTYKKVLLHPDEVEYIKKMGGNVGVNATLKELREQSLQQIVEANKHTRKIYMIHPDDTGCIFLECHNGLYCCRIYHYRPHSCRGFRCNTADDSFRNLIGDNAIHLLGLNNSGLPLTKNDNSSSK